MKKLFFLVLLFSNFFGYAQYTAIPDVNFEKALINKGFDDIIDKRVLTANISTISAISVHDLNIFDLTGIQDFVSLTYLSCGGNPFTSLDISKNTFLTEFGCIGSLLTTIDFSKNISLTKISIYNSKLKDIDISKNIDLQILLCNNNNLAIANLKNRNNTKLTTLDLTQNKNLICIEVDNKAYSNTNWSSKKDPSASYSENCSKIASNVAPIISATNNLNPIYCPQTNIKIATDVIITDPDDTSTDAIYIQISSGYITGQDILTLTGSYPNIISNWIPAEGKLILSSSTTSLVPYSDFETAIKNVEFYNSSLSPSGIRNFSISLGTGQANYLPRNGHFYEYVANLAIMWSAAKALAETKTYYGLKGYLATITAADEAQLAGKQAPGAGWIGGSDAETEGVWKWVTGPESGTVFWNGVANGSTPNFAFWNAPNEPNNSGNEDYAHITAPGVGIAGSWNDLPDAGRPSGNYQPKGYIVEYGGMPGDLPIEISTSTTITIAKITATTPSPICASATCTLQAGATTGEINWYDTATNGVSIGTGNSFTTPPLYTTTTYYIDNGCTPRTPIIVTVNPLPIANPVIIPRQCDDNQDGIFTFTTATLESTLLGNQTNITVTYFDQNNNPLKDSNGNLITSPFPVNFTTTSQTIKAVAKNALFCSNETNIPLIVDDLPEAFAVPTSLTTTCDDETNPLNQDGKFAFNTATFETSILKGQTGMTVKYFDKNGNSLSSPLPNPFVTATQNVLVTVTNTANTRCTTTATLNFVVNPLPIVYDVTIIQCDTDLISDGKTLFNLTVNNNLISANYTNENFTYYTSQSGANNGLTTDLISNDLTFENTTPSTMNVWVRVANKISGCYSVSKLTLKVPATNLLSSYKITVPPVCDDFLDAINNNRDGIATFDFSWTKATIQTQLPINQVYTINYYRNQADALAEINVIADISNYRNIGYRDSQDIWIRVESSLNNACVGLGPYITLKVEALPIANSVIIPRQCDDNQDGIFTFDTTTLESKLLKGQMLTDVIVTYFDQNNNPLPSPFPNTFTTASQTIKAVITNKTTSKCYDQTSIPFIVDISPKSFAVSSALTTACDDEADPLIQDGKFAFDTSTFEATILGGQTGMTVTYSSQNGTVLSNFSPTFITGTQNITATVINPLNTSCTATITLNFVVNPIPKINLNTNGGENELVCSNLPSFFVTLAAGIQDGSPTSNYTYIWSKDETILIGKIAPTLSVNAEGNYAVEVTNSSGCNTIRTIKVTASNLAHIESIDIIDLTDINTVTLNVTGKGKYEYSLDEPSGFWQDSNFFDKVPAGIHEVFINDKNGCGVVSKTIAVIGAPKFFTPNNDGYNDYWSVKGVNETFNSKSIIYIFDRYGKLIKQWVPNLNQGWDGTFNGIPAPADDYWFTLKLEDGREAKDHFSLKR
ncbi:T9SS type B sorting domain-containing protein [Flavobacterium sp. LB1P62]|uniref:T9SS type B sorting domain-containing protein n=1 Tax=Flavobacterium sp. LB1P62 TaxID=3401715 RepID=UPI003AABB754